MSPMKIFATILLPVCFISGMWPPIVGRAQSVNDRPGETKGFTLKWLDNAGWEIQIGLTVVLIDPFLTRGEANPSTEWKTDEEAVLGRVKRADYIFAGHSHADHIADLPFIAKKFAWRTTGAGFDASTIFGSIGARMECYGIRWSDGNPVFRFPAYGLGGSRLEIG